MVSDGPEVLLAIYDTLCSGCDAGVLVSFARSEGVPLKKMTCDWQGVRGGARIWVGGERTNAPNDSKSARLAKESAARFVMLYTP